MGQNNKYFLYKNIFVIIIISFLLKNNKNNQILFKF